MAAAASLVQSIVESTNALLERLVGEGFAWKHAARAQSDDCLLECTLFEWFLRDIELMRGFGTSASAVRQAVAGRLLIDLQRSGVSPACFHDFEERRRDRFDEYAEALAVSSSLQPLGAAVWRRISGSREPSERMTMLLAVRASAELARLRGLASSYRAVSTLPSPPSTPEVFP
jgi:hypothetical protein